MERTRPPPRTSQRTRSITRQKKGPRKTLGPTVEENRVQELPNLPGKTHGIKHINPIIVQCDDCLSAHTTESASQQYEQSHSSRATASNAYVYALVAGRIGATMRAIMRAC